MNKKWEDRIEWYLENNKKVLLFVGGLNLIAIAALLLLATNGQGVLYDYLAPDIYEEQYIYKGQYVNDNGDVVYKVIPLDRDTGTLIYPPENILDINKDDIITVTWVKQKLEEPYVYNIYKYNETVNVAMIDYSVPNTRDKIK